MEGRRRRGLPLGAVLLAGMVGGSLWLALLSPMGARADAPPGEGRLAPPGPRIEQTPGSQDTRPPHDEPPDPSKTGLQVVVALVPADRALAALNEGRAAAGKPPLRPSPILAEAARRAAEGMAAGCVVINGRHSSFGCSTWHPDRVRAIASSLGYLSNITITTGVFAMLGCGEAYPVTTELPDCLQPIMEDVLRSLRRSMVATGDDVEAGAYAACGRYARWWGYWYEADYGCFLAALGGKGNEAPPPPPPAPAPPSPPADAPQGGTSSPPAGIPQRGASPPPPLAVAPAPTSRSAPAAAPGTAAVSTPADVGGQTAAAATDEAPLSEGLGVVEGSSGDMAMPAEASPSPPSGPMPDRLAAGWEGRKEKRLPLVSHVVEAWGKMASAVRSLLERLS